MAGWRALMPQMPPPGFGRRPEDALSAVFVRVLQVDGLVPLGFPALALARARVAVVIVSVLPVCGASNRVIPASAGGGLYRPVTTCINWWGGGLGNP